MPESLFFFFRILLALLSGFSLVFAYPAYDFEALSWFALVPLLVSLVGVSLFRGFCLGCVTGVIYFSGIFYWIKITNLFNWVEFSIAVFYLSTSLGVFCLGLVWISKETRFPQLLTAPAMWVALEYLRSHMGFLQLPWGSLAHSQYLNIYLIQLASWTGTYGVSFVIVMANVFLSQITIAWCFRTIPNFSKPFSPILPQALAVIIVGTFVVLFGSHVVANGPKPTTLPVTVIQGNIPQDAKWKPELKGVHLTKHLRLTTTALQAGPTSLVVWPELSAQGRLNQDWGLRQTLTNLAKEMNTHLIIGSGESIKFGDAELKRTKSFNSAFFITPNGQIKDEYQKIHLLPFAEYLPLKDVIPWPARYFSLDDTFPGNTYTVFSLGKHRFSTLICWEMLFPDLVRQFVNNGAEFLVNMSNEAWFSTTHAPYQFLVMNVFRAVENRIAIARSSNTGVSAMIDPHGRISGRVRQGDSDIFVEGFLTMALPLRTDHTFYSQYGDIFVYVNICLVLIGFIAVWLLRRNRSTSHVVVGSK